MKHLLLKQLIMQSNSWKVTQGGWMMFEIDNAPVVDRKLITTTFSLLIDPKRIHIL